MAYNHWSLEGICELLPALAICQETQLERNCTFSHLGTCSGVGSRMQEHFDISQVNGCWAWAPFTGDPMPTHSVTCDTPRYHIGAVEHMGMYLPTWLYGPDGLQRSLGIDDELFRCNNGYVLIRTGSCTDNWQSFTAGQPVPDNAVVGGLADNGLPLYIIRSDLFQLADGARCGYYRMDTQTASFMYYSAIHPEVMEILVTV